MKHLAYAPLVLLLGACSANFMPGLSFGERSYVSRAPTVPVEIRPVAHASTAAAQMGIGVLALHDAAGRVLKVRERHFVNGTRQEIVLDGGPGVYGENVIDVSVRTSGVKTTNSRMLEMGPPTESAIRSEILGRFADMRMNIVLRPMRNRFGPFGLAIGRHANGARCIFVWQWVDDLREHTPGVSSFAKFGALMGNRALATSIRMRLCRMGLTVDQLAGYAEAMRVPARAPVERLASMNRRDIGDPQISQNGIRRSPLLKPVGSSLESALGGKPAAGKPVAGRKSSARSASSEPRAIRKARRAPAGDYNRIQHYSAGGAPAVSNSGASAGPQGRYLAPVNSGAAPAAEPQVRYRPNSGAGLPPEAFRGPQKN